jgi:predicted Holliday junction resolvase-like endonuclease
MKSTLASAPNASASITSRSISEIADAPDDSDAKKHHDLRRTEIERSETNVVIVAEAIVGFIIPFKMEQKDKLYCQTTFSNLIV